MAPGSEVWLVPELGPSLGRLVDPHSANRGALGVALDDVRLDLVTGVFDLAGAGRSFATSGDHGSAVASLGRMEWLRLWEKAVAATAVRITAEANAALRSAAEESRFPKRRLRRLELTDDDTRAIGARLGSGGAGLVAALDTLDQAGHATGGGSGRGAVRGPGLADGIERDGTAARVGVDRAGRGGAGRAGAVGRGDLDGARVAPADLAGLAHHRGSRRGRGLRGPGAGGYLPVPPVLESLAAFWWARL